MIILFACRGFTNTHRPIQRERTFDFRVWTYERLFRAHRVPRATFIFSDLERLHPWDMEMAARIGHQLHAADARVLNDPARAHQRYQLLVALQREGINDFGVWHLGEEPPEGAYPVFLRTEYAHRGVLTDLIHTPGQLAEACERALAAGHPRRDLIIVQYRAESITPGLYRKLGTWRVGDTIVPALCAHEPHWMAKRGVLGCATEAWYEDEYRMVTTNPHGRTLQRAFDIARIDYGRADYGLIDQRPQVYEINTNPMVVPPGDHPFTIRVESMKRFQQNLNAAIAAIDGPASGPSIRITDARPLRRRMGDLMRSRRYRRVPRMP